MKWFSGLFGSKSAAPGRAGLGPLRLAAPWGREVERSESRVMWVDDSETRLSIDLVDISVFPPVSADEQEIREFCRTIAENNGGAVISVDAVMIARRPATQLIYKREKPPAYAYTGMLLLPLGGYGYVIVIAAIEQGMTGIREAIITAGLFEEGKLSSTESYEKSWFQDPFDPNYSGPVLRSMADDETYDPDFPEHPLSRIRAALKDFQTSISLEFPDSK